MTTLTRIVLVLLAGLVPAAALAQTDASSTSTDQSSFWSAWLARSDQAKADQTHWITPVATTTPRLEQEFRSDVMWRRSPAGYTENIGGGKGLELIPVEPLEVILSVPPYFDRNGRGGDGFGDARLLVKYRLLASPEDRGNAILTAFLDVSLPTGSAGNGQPSTVITPTLAYGKGVGAFDVQGTVGVALPTSHEAQIGRTYTWNNALQYRVGRRLWPELEVNASWARDGLSDPRPQVYVTPGVVVGRLPLTSRLGLTLGAGVQIAASAFHTSSHNIILSARLPF